MNRLIPAAAEPVIASGVIHTVYFFALAKAYEYGDISVVYPIARGSGIVGTAIAGIFLLQETISPIGLIGILAISVGIYLLGLKNGHQKPADKANNQHNGENGQY